MEHINRENELDPEMAQKVRSIVAPVLLPGEELSDDDIAIIAAKAEEIMEARKAEEKDAVLEGAALRFQAKGKLKNLAPSVQNLVIDRGGVIGSAETLEEAKEIIRDERANMDSRNTF